MRFPDYGKCKIRSTYMARELRKENILSYVVYGVYKPPAARRTWDERWQVSKSDEFVHFWLNVGKLLYDYSAFQFGAKERVRTSLTNKSYEQLGYYDFMTGEMQHTGNLIINWESLKEINGVPVVTLEPVFI